jgi:hypothetical protein
MQDFSSTLSILRIIITFAFAGGAVAGISLLLRSRRKSGSSSEVKEDRQRSV